MPQSLIAPEYELFPNRYRWTVQECREMAEAGKLVGRYEILDGEVVSKMGQNPAHALALTNLTEAMATVFGLSFLRIQTPIALDSADSLYTEPEPDIVVTRCPAKTYVDRHPGPEDVILLAEVADTTLRTDVIVKARLYARSSIHEYWIVDIVGRQVQVFSSPIEGLYTAVEVYGEADVLPAGQNKTPVPVSQLLPPPSP